MQFPRKSLLALTLLLLFPLTLLTACGNANSAPPDPQSSGGIPSSPAPTPASVQHLIIVMMQNHSFDNLFGTYPGANGLDPSAASYQQTDSSGNTVSPTLLTQLSTGDLNHTQPSYIAAWDNGKMDKYAYTNGDLSMQYYDNTVSGAASDGRTFGISTLWSYAQNYALADNFFASAMNTEPADELYQVAATVVDAQTADGLPYYDPCSASNKAAYGGYIDAPLTATTVGDQLTGKNITWAWYQQSFDAAQAGNCSDYAPQENIFQYFTSTANSSHISDFNLADFQASLQNGSLPSVVWLQADGLHDMHPGSGNILDGIEWLDNIVQAVKSSPLWPNTAIIVLWDESGGWYDHVAPPQLQGTEGLGARVPVIIISPLAKSGYISHQQMDFVSILRFIQWNWKLGEFSDAGQAAREQQSGDLCDLLTSSCGAPAPSN